MLAMLPRAVGIIGLGLLPLLSFAATAEEYRLSLRLNESEPVLVNGLEFVAITQSQWTFYNPPIVDGSPEVQLRITNRSQEDLIFSTFDTFLVQLVGPDARVIERGGGRNGTRRTRPVLIPAGKTYTLCRETRTQWDEAGKTMNFVYLDGTGTIATYALPEPGRYTLRFECEYPVERNGEPLREFEGVKVWHGKVKTKAARMEVLRLSARSRPNFR